MTILPATNTEYFLRRGEGHTLNASPAGDRITFKATGAENDGRLSFLEYESTPGFPGPPPHMHSGHEELFYVLTGQLKMLVGDEVVDCRPGDFAYAPRNVAHTFWNEGDALCTFVAAFSPAGFEGIFEHFHLAIEQGRAMTQQEEIALAERFDMTIVQWPQGPPPVYLGT